MNCKETRTRIDHLVFEPDSLSEKEIKIHLKGCDECTLYYKDRAGQAGLLKALRNHEPALTHPDLLTNAIMDSINAKESTPKNFYLTTLSRILAAACVCLLFTFGYEQYNILIKLNTLERQFAEISTNQEISSGNGFQNLSALKSKSLASNEKSFFSNILKRKTPREREQYASEINSKPTFNTDETNSILLQRLVIRHSGIKN